MSGGSEKNPNRVMYSSSRVLAELLADLGEGGVDRVRERVVRVIGPKLSVPALQSGRPCTVMQWPLASISGESGP